MITDGRATKVVFAWSLYRALFEDSLDRPPKNLIDQEMSSHIAMMTMRM